MAIREQAQAPPETYGDLILRALADGELSPEAYFWCKSGADGFTYHPAPRAVEHKALPHRTVVERVN